MIVLSGPRGTHRLKLIRVQPDVRREMKIPTYSSPPPEIPSSDAVVASAYQPYPPRPAFDSAWERLLSVDSIEVLHTWLDNESASNQPLAGDVA